MFVVTGEWMPGVGTAGGEEALWQEIRRLAEVPAAPGELEKVRNKFEANMLYGELNVMNKALNLGYYAMLGDLSLLNGEAAIYRAIGAEELRQTAERLLCPEKSSTLIIYGDHEA